MLRVAVVGHVEWITFARVEQVPAAGGIAHASETWTGAGGGGGVAARQLAKLAGSCDLFAAFGEDEIADRAREELAADGVRVYAETRPQATRQAVCLIDPSGERTITTLGPRLQARGSDPLPWDRLGEADAVYVTAGDEEAIRRARAARIMVVSTRHRETLAASGVQADAVVGSDRDPAERYEPDLLAHAPPGLVVLTQGADGGRFQTADGGDRTMAADAAARADLRHVRQRRFVPGGADLGARERPPARGGARPGRPVRSRGPDGTRPRRWTADRGRSLKRVRRAARRSEPRARGRRRGTPARRPSWSARGPSCSRGASGGAARAHVA